MLIIQFLASFDRLQVALTVLAGIKVRWVAVDNPNDNSLEFDDEGGDLLESNGMDVDEDPMEYVVAPKGKRKSRGKTLTGYSMKL